MSVNQDEYQNYKRLHCVYVTVYVETWSILFWKLSLCKSDNNQWIVIEHFEKIPIWRPIQNIFFILKVYIRVLFFFNVLTFVIISIFDNGLKHVILL